MRWLRGLVRRQQAHSLEIRYRNRRDGLMFRNPSVWIDSSLAGTVADTGDLAKGREFQLNDERFLKMRFKDGWEIFLDDEWMSDELENPRKELNEDCRALWILAGLHFLVGATAPTWPFAGLLELISRFDGLLYALLTVFIWRRSYVAIIAFAIFVLGETVTVQTSQFFPLLFTWEILYLLLLVKPFFDMRYLKHLTRAQRDPSP